MASTASLPASASRAARTDTPLGSRWSARTVSTAPVPTGFVSATGLERLRHLPRYLEGILLRVRKLQENPGRDRQAMNQLEASIAAFETAGGRIPIDPESPAHLVRVRWMLEELRVGLFAQELRTAETVSPQRIAKALVG